MKRYECFIHPGSEFFRPNFILYFEENGSLIGRERYAFWNCADNYDPNHIPELKKVMVFYE